MGDAQRAAAYATLLVARLRGDPRVEHAFRGWLLRHGFDADPTAAARAYRHDARDGEEMRVLVESLRIACHPLPYLLLRDFAARLVSRDPLGVEVSPPTVDEVPTDFPPGRSPRQTDDYLARDVDWYYRVTVQRGPGDSKHRIAKTAGVTRPTVQAAVDRVARLLATFDLDDSNLAT